MYYDSIKHFKDQFFLVAPLNKEGRAKVCNIGSDVEYRCTNLFSKFWIQGNFLTGNESYVYMENDLTQKELYLKKWLITFLKKLGYGRDVILQDKASVKHLK